MTTPPASRMVPLLERNRAFAAGGARHDVPPLPFVPRQLLYVLTCVDPRVDPAEVLGVRLGDAVVHRTVGGRVTPAVVQDLAWVAYLADTLAPQEPAFEVAVVHHTDCGSALLADPVLRRGFVERTGLDEAGLEALAVVDPERSVARDVDLLLAARGLSSRVAVSGHVLDVATGLVRTVVEPRLPTAS